LVVRDGDVPRGGRGRLRQLEDPARVESAAQRLTGVFERRLGDSVVSRPMWFSVRVEGRGREGGREGCLHAGELKVDDGAVGGGDLARGEGQRRAGTGPADGDRDDLQKMRCERAGAVIKRRRDHVLSARTQPRQRRGRRGWLRT
jgi:hypothetical protein